MYLVGYDIGSSYIKAALIDAATKQSIAVVEYPESELDMIARQSGWAEQQPESWWQGVCRATQQLLKLTSIQASAIRKP